MTKNVKKCIICDFNPRSREGSDDMECKRGNGNRRDFNPRSREGSDRPAIRKINPAGLFQSTLPRGERLALRLFCVNPAEFQSTLPRGERLQFYLKFTLCF